MTAARKSKKPARAASAAYHSHPSADFRVGIPELREIAGRVFKLSDADETEVEIGAVSDALTRFANNTIHQHVAEQNLALSVRVVFDGCTARAVTNKTDEASLRRVVEAASSLARVQRKDPNLLPMPRQQKYQKVRAILSHDSGCHAAGPRPRRRASLFERDRPRSRLLREFFPPAFGIGAGEFARPLRALRADARGILDHDS